MADATCQSTGYSEYLLTAPSYRFIALALHMREETLRVTVVNGSDRWSPPVEPGHLVYLGDTSIIVAYCRDSANKNSISVAQTLLEPKFGTHDDVDDGVQFVIDAYLGATTPEQRLSVLKLGRSTPCILSLRVDFMACLEKSSDMVDMWEFSWRAETSESSLLCPPRREATRMSITAGFLFRQSGSGKVPSRWAPVQRSLV